MVHQFSIPDQQLRLNVLFVQGERSNSTPLVIASEASVETGRGKMKAFLGYKMVLRRADEKPPGSLTHG